ncbi:MAG: CaiB/BaiF CoA transferase family protein [Nitriliruptorales bacterium]
MNGNGPLTGVRIVEVAAIGPAPFGVMLLADLGADVIRVDRAARVGKPGQEVSMGGLSRARRSVAVDLKHPDGLDVLLRLVDGADVLVEGFRPGVAERLGFGPDACLDRNPRLVYARMTGWGQDGPLADRAGHDIDYAAVAGALHPIGRAGEPPPPPLNLVADFGGGGAYLALGVLAALFERERSGHGQVVDAAMVDGVASLTAFFHGLLAIGAWKPERATNLLDGAAPFYDTYAAADGGFVAVGCLEPEFYAEFLDRLDLDPEEWPQFDTARWPEQKRRLAEIFATRTRDEWAEVFAGSDACVAPVLSLTEAPDHPHLAARKTFVEVGGARQPAPAPRFSRTPGQAGDPAPEVGEHTDEIVRELGLDVAALRTSGAVA